MQTQSLSLLDFVLANKGTDAFWGYDDRKIEETLRQHIFKDTILCTQDEEGNYTGVLLWSYESWIPMRVYIDQLIGKNQAGRLLKELRKRLPPQFYIYADRKRGKKKVVYKNPDRVVNFMLRKDSSYGKR